jgi:hypothetical protein
MGERRKFGPTVAGRRSVLSYLFTGRGDKSIVSENHGDGKRARISVGSDQKATRSEYRYRSQHFRRPAFRQVAQEPDVLP